MDLNYILKRHQVSLMRAEAAAGGESRIAHQAFARRYADLIEAFRAARKLPRWRGALQVVARMTRPRR
jgi:hypothetical protein